MASKRPLSNTPRRSGNLTAELVRLLRSQLRAASAREKELLALLRERDEQIRTVIDEKYFHPVNLKPKPLDAKPAKVYSAEDFRHLSDQPEFDPVADAEIVAECERRFLEAETSFNAQLTALEKEHEASHEEEPEPTAAEESLANA